VGYLSESFIVILREITDGKLRDMSKVIERIELVIE
jgi:hypothetical protein